jgi:hypothetical protein
VNVTLMAGMFGGVIAKVIDTAGLELDETFASATAADKSA